MGKSYEKESYHKCLICHDEFKNGKRFSNHLKKDHDLKSLEYTIKYLYNGIIPNCLECHKETRYTSFTFKKYCIDHSHIAESMAGKIGGKIKETWNKGKTAEEDPRIAALANTLKGEGNPFYGKQHSIETIDRISSIKRLSYENLIEKINECAPNITLLSEYSEYKKVSTELRIKCNFCSTEDNVSLFNLNRCWSCKKCHPNGSKAQVEILDYVKSLGFDAESSTRKIISPLEIDIWIAEKNIGIEYHGLYWHSGGKSDVFNKGKHREKFKSCEEKNIKLIQIFSDEWREKKDIVKSIIRNALGKNELKIHGRKCEVKRIEQGISKEFLVSSHISGSTRAQVHFGLYHPEHGLVGVITGRVPIQKKWGKVFEVARMAFLKNTSVVGGASKLLKQLELYAKENGYEGVLTYADLRFGDGGVYQKSGYELKGETSTNYWYTEGLNRYNRFMYRAKEGKSETEVALENKVRPVWGAGNKIYLKHNI